LRQGFGDLAPRFTLAFGGVTFEKALNPLKVPPQHDQQMIPDHDTAFLLGHIFQPKRGAYAQIEHFLTLRSFNTEESGDMDCETLRIVWNERFEIGNACCKGP
jgi:hypothetical protein